MENSGLSPGGRSLFKIPFNGKATTLAGMDEVDVYLNPKSKFVIDIQKIMSIFCQSTEGKWIPIDNNSAGLQETIYDQLNRISKIGRTLWDCEGKPKPLALKICAVPFSKQEGSQSMPLHSCIVAGLQSVHNINSDPSWQTLSVDWWKPEQSLVGLTLKSKNTNSKAYRTVQPASALWSFFALLKEAEQKEGNAWAWKLASREGQDHQQVSFLFETNPQELLAGVR